MAKAIIILIGLYSVVMLWLLSGALRQKGGVMNNKYKGYIIKDYSNVYGPKSYSIEGCIWIFDTKKSIRDYIDEHDSIEPSETGAMKYIGTVID